MNRITKNNIELFAIKHHEKQATNTSTPSPTNYTGVNGHE
jgi:hypothetical protein